MGQLTKKITLLILVVIPFAFWFGISDLEISRLIVNQNSGWAMFLQNYGMIPGIIVILIGIFIYYSSIKSKTDFFSYTIRIVFFLVGSGLIFYLFEILLEDFVLNNLVLFLIISFAIGFIIFMIIHKVSQVKNPVAIKYSKVIVGMSLYGYVIGIQVTKYLWGRVRFRELDESFSQFTPWYLPQGITGFDSFPSGHAAMGWMLLPLLILFINKNKWVRIFVFSLILFWGIVLASSRVVAGAHYASDVLFGSFFIVIAFLLLSQYHINKFQTTSTK